MASRACDIRPRGAEQGTAAFGLTAAALLAAAIAAGLGIFLRFRVAKKGANALVDIHDLRVSFRQDDGSYSEAVRGVSLSLGREKLGIVGESGSGKSLTGRSLLGVLPPYARMSVERMSFDGIDLTRASAR